MHNFSVSISELVTQEYDWNNDGTVDGVYEYATFTATFEDAYQLYAFYEALSPADQTRFDNLYITAPATEVNFFDLVTQTYDWNNDGTVDGEYNYVDFTANFSAAAALQGYYDTLTINEKTFWNA